MGCRSKVNASIILLTKIGEKCELYIKPEYGYGSSGSPPSIPGNSVLIFEVELFGIDESTGDMTVLERISKAEGFKEKGNAAFKYGSVKDSIGTFMFTKDIILKLLNVFKTLMKMLKNQRFQIF